MKYYKSSKTLSNGQVVTVFWRQDIWTTSAMEVFMVIGKSISDNKKWFNGHINFSSVKSTGNCGLDGLLFALSVIKDLQKQYNLTIEWLDGKRERAYAYLERLGFRYGHYTEHPEVNCLYWIK